MVRRSTRIILLALALMLSACFRPAGEAIEPTPNTGQPAASSANDDAPLTEEATDEEPMRSGNDILGVEVTVDANGSALSDDELPPITVIVPTRPAQTDVPSGSSFTTSSTAVPGTTPTYITPGVPLGLIPEATATPTGGAFTATPSGLVTPTDMFVSAVDGACIYTVQPGDYLYRIAMDHDIALEDLRAANPDLQGEAPILDIGQQLNLPCATPQPEAPQQAEPETVPQATVMPGGQTYTVQAGDTLFTIAREFGVTIADIVAANNMPNPDSLDIGQQLVIPPPSS